MMPSVFQYDLYRVLAPGAAACTLWFFVTSLGISRRRRAAASVYSVFAAGTIGYLLANLMEICSTSRAEGLFWSRLVYVFVGFLPIVWLEFSLRFTRSGRGLSRGLIAVFAAIPIATLVIVFSPRLVWLMWPSIEWLVQGPYVVSIRSHGSWFDLYAAYTYGFFLVGAAIMVRAFVLYRSFYRRQAFSILMGIAVPMAASLIYVLRPFPGLVKDYTPLAYAASVAFFNVALFRRDLFALAPVTRGLVLERMQDGVLVLDDQGRVTDANASALGMIGAGESIIGRPFSAPGLDTAELLASADSGRATEFARGEGETGRFYSALPMRLGKGLAGVVVVIRDVTEARILLRRVERLASTDELTGMPNRRSFMLEAERELARALRHATAFAVAMFDIDRFKAINDVFGHATGDVALCEFARIVTMELRKEDAAGRIGGEEFALVLSGASVEDCLLICERIRARVDAHSFTDAGGRPLHMTVSAGISYLGADRPRLDTLLSRADRALYEAKAEGRNRVAVWRPESGREAGQARLH
jgi:diguanylate cyclase (GGDEF)-like protein